MALIKCPECLSEISERKKICPHCGSSVNKWLSEKAWKYAKILKERETEFGNVTRIIKLYSAYSPHNIFVFESAKTVFICNNQYSFNDILSCQVDARIYMEKMYYYVFIGVKDIHAPLITISLWHDFEKANEIWSLFNTIINSR